MSDKPTLLVTGISGFLGSWVAKKALETGLYNVRGTVQSLKNKEKLEILEKGFGEEYKGLDLVEMSLEDEEQVAKAVEGCKYVVHTASPFTMEEPKDPENTVIKPAVKGVENIVQKSKLTKTVERVVFTSSAL